VSGGAFAIQGRTGWWMGRGCPLPSRLEGLGERCKLQQRGPGRSPGRKCILVNFYLPKRFWWPQFLLFYYMKDVIKLLQIQILCKNLSFVSAHTELSKKRYPGFNFTITSGYRTGDLSNICAQYFALKISRPYTYISECFQLQWANGFAPWPPTRGFVPGPHWGHSP